MKPIVTQNPEKPVAAEIIAQSIVDIAAAMKRIDQSRLTRKALVVLIHDNSRIGKREIEIVLNNLSALESTWLKRTA